jgi:hypothetical protein
MTKLQSRILSRLLTVKAFDFGRAFRMSVALPDDQ